MRKTEAQKKAYIEAKTARLIQAAHDTLEQAMNQLQEAEAWRASLRDGQYSQLPDVENKVLGLRNRLRLLGAKEEK